MAPLIPSSHVERIVAAALALTCLVFTNQTGAQQQKSVSPEAQQRRIAATDITVSKFKDFRGYPPRVAQTGAARASKDAIAVTLFGDDPEKLKAIQKAINTLSAAGWPIGLVLADGWSAQTEVYVHVNGQVAFPKEGTQGVVPSHAGLIQDLIVSSYNRYRESLQAPAGTPRPPGR